jgi:hypothetical protein
VMKVTLSHGPSSIVSMVFIDRQDINSDVFISPDAKKEKKNIYIYCCVTSLKNKY